MNSRPWGFLLTGFALLAGLLFVFSPQPEPAPTPTPAASPARLQAAVPSPSPKTYELVVRGRKLVNGERSLQAKQGEELSIRITVDEAEELHLHGYNLKLDLSPGKPGTLTFLADKSGRFEYELEKSRTELGVLEVQPR
jgi:hypothetical protein